MPTDCASSRQGVGELDLSCRPLAVPGKRPLRRIPRRDPELASQHVETAPAGSALCLWRSFLTDMALEVTLSASSFLRTVLGVGLVPSASGRSTASQIAG